jgi:catechol 2,3-dioxygenase-like lactoylglutathione lyase family enzyme
MAWTMRVARPTTNLAAIERFYGEGLGLTELSRFADHDGFDGLIMGEPGVPHHLEFTTEHDGRPPFPSHPEDVLAFYASDADAYRATIDRLDAIGAPRKISTNPWWDEGGVTFEDPDGRRVVVTSRTWLP